MRPALRLAFILIIYALSARPQEHVSFCDLVQHPLLNSGREVTVRATYRVGFELSDLYCLDCSEEGKAWLEFDEDLDRASRRALRRVPNDWGVVNLTVQGIFVSGDHYGHERGYRHKFHALKVRDVVVIIKGMKPPEEERRLEKLYACGGASPK